MRTIVALVLSSLALTSCASHTIDARSVRGHMEFMASDAMNGRGSGTRDECCRGARIVADPHPDQNFFERSDNIVLARKGVVAQTVKPA